MAAKVDLYEKQAELQKRTPAVQTPKVRNATAQAPSRRGKVGTTLHFHPDAHKMLRELAVERDTNITALLVEGVNLMLQSYGRKPIA